MITCPRDIQKLSASELEKLESYVSDSGEYIIPVQWTVYSTIKVEANNLREALEKAAEKVNDLPLSSENEYISDSYAISVNDAEDAFVAQEYNLDGGITIDTEGTILT